MRLLVVSPLGVYPPKGGGETRIYNINLKLSKHDNIDKVYLFSQGVRFFELKFPPKSWFTEINEKYVEYRFINSMTILSSYITNFFNIQPIFYGNILEKSKPKQFVKELKNSDIIKVEFPWQFEFIFRNNSKSAPVILDEHNVELYLMKQTIRNIPLISGKLINIIKRKEEFACKNADAIFTVSDDDKKRLSEIYNISNKKIHVIPNGVDAEFYTTSFEEKEEIKNRLGLTNKRIVLFTGWGYPPNIEATQKIIKISNKIKNKNVLFLVVGRCGETFKNIKKDNILFTGYIDDITPYFKVADIAINPMLSGGGTNIKMLEYMASGLPVISTPIGARGLDIVNNEHAIIANIDDFPEKLEELLNDEEMQKNLSQNGRKLVEEKYDWGKIAEKEMRILEKMVQ
jgi:glycosyltransferase involved in cell wall biosynthesis